MLAWYSHGACATKDERCANDRFGTDFTDEDRLLMEQVVGDLAKDEGLSAQARSNSLDNFRHVFEPKATHAVLERNERNSEIVQQFIANDEIRRLWLDAMIREYHARAQTGAGTGDKADQTAANAAA